MQLEPVKPKLKPSETKRLKQKCDTQLSTSAFKFNLRRYTKAAEKADAARKAVEAGAYTRPHFGTT